MLVEHRAHVIKGCIVDRTAVAVVDIARQVFLADRVDQRLAQFGLERRHMKQMRLVEPDLVAGDRVARHTLTHLARTQRAVVQPLALDAVARAVRLHLGLLAGVEHLLPRQIEPVAVVAHIHQPARGKTVADERVDILEDRATVGDRRLAALLCRDVAVEPDLHRPLARVRLLVVQRDMLMRRVLGRGIDPTLADLAARRRPELVVQERMAE